MLTKVICPKKQKLNNFPRGDPRKEADQDGNSGEEDVREYSRCGRHLQEENTGDQVEHAVNYPQYSNILESPITYKTWTKMIKRFQLRFIVSGNWTNEKVRAKTGRFCPILEMEIVHL